jgi:hypothetical protein
MIGCSHLNFMVGSWRLLYQQCELTCGVAATGCLAERPSDTLWDDACGVNETPKRTLLFQRTVLFSSSVLSVCPEPVLANDHVFPSRLLKNNLRVMVGVVAYLILQVDEGVANVTQAMKTSERWKETVFIFSTSL